MRSNFPGYYSLSKELLDEVWGKAVLILDTNVLLDFYRVSPETQSDLLRVVKYYAEQNRLWIPYQVATEYHDNLYKVIFEQVKKYDETLNILKDFLNSISQKRNHPFLTDNFIRRINNLKRDLEKYFELQRKKLRDSVGDATLKDDIANIFEGHIGEPFIEEQLNSIYEEGKKRYALHIPPGFEDRKKGEPDMYNDFLVWSEVIEFSKENKVPVFFISSDTKKDWYLIEQGQTICPLPALIKEFNLKTNQHILMYTLERFLSLAKERKVVHVQEDSIKEVKTKDEKTADGNSFIFTFYKHLNTPTEVKAGEVESLFKEYKLNGKRGIKLFSAEADELGSTTSNSLEKNGNNTNDEYNNNSNS